MLRSRLLRPALFLVAVAAPLQPGLAQDLEQVLDSVRAALAQPDQGTWALTGTTRASGLDGRFELVFDADGRFRQTVDGRLSVAEGFDGEVAWERDHNGVSRQLVLGELEGTRMRAWLLTGHWLDPRAGLEMDLRPEREDGSWIVELAQPGGEMVVALAVDGGTWLPRAASWAAGMSDFDVTWEEWGETDGMAHPVRFSVHGGGREEEFRVTSLETRPASAATFARLPTAGEALFDAELPPELDVKRAPTGHLLVRPVLQGEELGWFIFDTGAGVNVLSSHVVERLGLETFGSMKARGVGGEVESSFLGVSSLQLGPVTLEDTVFSVMDLAFLDGPMGGDFAGVLGYGVIARCVVEIDMQAPRIALHDPKHYELPRGTDWQDLILFHRHPCVEGTYEGHTGIFRIDTGAGSGNVTMHAPAVERHGLLEGRSTGMGRLGGVGGTVSARMGRLDWFELGGHRFEAVNASFATEEKGPFGDPYTDGNIGGGLLKPFELVLDYSNRRMGLVEKSERP